MELIDLPESKGQFSGTIYSLAKGPFSLNSPWHPLAPQEPLFLGL